MIQPPPRLTAEEAEAMLEEYRQAYPERARQVEELKRELVGYQYPPKEHVMQAVRPLRDRVIVKRQKEEEKTSGGIYIPQTASAQDQAWRAEVLAVGPGRLLDNGTLVPTDVKVGDKVLVGKYSGNELTVDGDKIVSLLESEILGVIEEG